MMPMTVKMSMRQSSSAFGGKPTSTTPMPMTSSRVEAQHDADERPEQREEARERKQAAALRGEQKKEDVFGRRALRILADRLARRVDRPHAGQNDDREQNHKAATAEVIGELFPENHAHLSLTEVLEINFFQGRVLGAELEQRQALVDDERRSFRTHVARAAEIPAASAALDALHARQSGERAVDAVRRIAAFDDEIPAPLLERGAAELVDLAGGDPLAPHDYA